MRIVGETCSFVEDSDRSCSGFRGGERFSGRGGEGIIRVCTGHNVQRSVSYVFPTLYRIYESMVKKCEKGVSCAGGEEAVGRSTPGMKDSVGDIPL